MVFSSFQFVLAFLPVTVAGFMLLQRFGLVRASSWWLIVASLFFYGWWDYRYLFVPLGSVVFNFVLGKRLQDPARRGPGLLIFGIAANLGLLGYYKYAGFFVENFAAISGLPLEVPRIALPLAISFCTFQQVSFLIDCHRKQVADFNFRRYLLYIVFFPHLIAGPVVRHYELMPQLEIGSSRDERWRNIVWGLHLFAIGLCKKTIIADMMATYADPVFGAAASGAAITMLEAWGGALSYTFQLYFDFSGYADMALGSARMLGVNLPQNFDSPYKAHSIADFWRRWHITLSFFLRDYLYIPLGGSRCGKIRTYANLFVTMLLGGLWHGAAWTFVFWGALHGAALAANHAWREISGRRGWRLPGRMEYLLTMLFVIVCWVVFRSSSLDSAAKMLSAMFAGPVVLPKELALLSQVEWLKGVAVSSGSHLGALPDSKVFLYVALLFVVCRFAPNSREWMEDFGFGSPRKLTLAHSLLVAVMISICMIAMLAHREVFIYYVF